MGAFLQVTNITRDYIEDVVDGRTFWPRDIWSKHVAELSDLRLDVEDTLSPTFRSPLSLATSVRATTRRCPEFFAPPPPWPAASTRCPRAP